MIRFDSTLLRTRSVAIFVIAAGTSLVGAYATPVPVTNGSFSSLLVAGKSSEFGSRFPSQQVTGWTTNGYNWVYTSAAAATTGGPGEFGNVALWGPGNGSANGLSVSPDGGNFIAMDANFGQGPLSQTLSGLTKGDLVTVSFYFAGAQQQGFSGATTDQLTVSLGGQSLATPTISNASKGFTGWQKETLTFTATGSSEVLSFLASGAPPSGAPPFTLLDGVTVDQVSPTPEPSSLLLLGSGILGVGGLVRRRFMKS